MKLACRLGQTDRRIHILPRFAAAGTTSGAVAEASHRKGERRREVNSIAVAAGAIRGIKKSAFAAGKTENVV